MAVGRIASTSSPPEPCGQKETRSVPGLLGAVLNGRKAERTRLVASGARPAFVASPCKAGSDRLNARGKNRLRVVLSQQPRGRSLVHRRFRRHNQNSLLWLDGLRFHLEPGNVRFGPSGLLGRRESPPASVSPGSASLSTHPPIGFLGRQVRRWPAILGGWCFDQSAIPRFL